MAVTMPPLLDLFSQLREAGLPLGIGEYQLVLKAWQAGYGRQDRAALDRLCRTVWVKSPEEAQIFAVQFERWLPAGFLRPDGEPQSSTPGEALGTPKTIALAILATSTVLLGICWLMIRAEPNAWGNQVAVLASQVNESSIRLYETALPLIQQADEVAEIQAELAEQEVGIQVISPSKPWWKQYGLTLWGVLWLGSGVLWAGLQWRSQTRSPQPPAGSAGLSLALTQQIRDEVQVVRLGHTLATGDYLPVTRRQMKQSWRYLRRMVRQGAPTELDVEATVQAIGRDGLLLAPVFRARRVNRAEVLLLVDQEGSMVPFQGLSQRLVETALQGGRLTQAKVYYFHNCPVDWLYHDPYQQTADSIDQVLQTLTSDYAGVLIVSDGGAAYGRWNPQRLKFTAQFLTQISRGLRYVAWLNPMPQDRWPGTTAGEIAKQVPMFEFDRAGLDAAITVLRGQGGHHP